MKYIYIVGQHASNFQFSKFINTIDTELDNQVEFLLPIPPTGVRLIELADNHIALQHVAASSMPTELHPILTKNVPLDDMCNAIDDTHKYVLAASIVTNYQIKEPELIARTQYFLYNNDQRQLVDFFTLQPLILESNQILLPMFSVTRFGSSNTFAVTANSSICAIPANIDIETNVLRTHTIGSADESLSAEILSPMVHDATVIGDIIAAPAQFFTIDFFSGINVKVDSFEQQLRWNAANISVKTNLEISMDGHSIRIRPAREKIGYLQVRANANEFFNSKDGIGGVFEYNKIIIQE